MAQPIVFLSGMPAAGKSTFGRWLRDNRHYTYVDMENEGPDGLSEQGLRPTWEQFIRDSNAFSFVQTLEARPGPIALDWGFPIGCLNIVRLLCEQNVRSWWFTGDRLRLREAFVAAGKGDVQFDAQYADLSVRWSEIAPIFAARIVRTVLPDGTRMSCEEIHRQIGDGD